MGTSKTNTFYHLDEGTKVYIYHSYYNRIEEGIYKGIDKAKNKFIIRVKNHNIEIDMDYIGKDISAVRYYIEDEYIFGLSIQDLYDNVKMDIEDNKDELLPTYIQNVEECFSKVL